MIPPDPKIVIAGQPAFVNNPKILLPANGGYTPITVSGNFSQVLTATLAGPYAVHPGAAIAQAQAELPNLPPQVKGQPLKVITLPLPPQDLFALGNPAAGIDNGIVETRLADRPIPGAATLQVTDQYRQDEPHLFSPIQNFQTVYQIIYASHFVFGDGRIIEVQYPTSIALIHNYSYSFTFHLQAKANSDTNGRQYFVTIYDVDGDDGAQTNFAILVPDLSAAAHKTRK